MGNGQDPAGVRAFVAGGVSGTAFLVAGQPFDTIKVRGGKFVNFLLNVSNKGS